MNPERTQWERRFAEILEDEGIYYCWQHVVCTGFRRRRYLDFYIPSAGVGIEIDGRHHIFKKKKDAKRTGSIQRNASAIKQIWRIRNWQVTQGAENAWVREVLDALKQYDSGVNEIWPGLRSRPRCKCRDIT